MDGRLLQVNASLCDMLGYTTEELVGLALRGVIGPEDVDGSGEMIRQVLSGDIPGFQLDARYLVKGGGEKWGHLTASLLSGGGFPREMLATVEDITERKDAEARLTQLALHDDLTGLANRALAMDRLQLAQDRAARTGAYVGLLLLDIDHFKSINDSLGHRAGDAVLVEAAKRLKSVLRPADTAARIGGDEFLVCCEGLGHDEADAQGAATAVAQRIAVALGEPVPLAGAIRHISASIGIALVRGTQQAPDVALHNADRAMYRAKHRGRSRFELFDQALQARADEHLAVAQDLRLALQRGELAVYYQPIVRLEDGHMVGAEALVRWEHPNRGLLLAAEFLDVAEESGLIVPVGDGVIRQACHDLAGWRATLDDDLFVTVNASARQLGHNGLGVAVRQALLDNMMGPRALHIELAEGTLIDAAARTLAELNELRQLGVHLGLDDFGTGYASLTFLRRLPVDFVKVDRSLVAGFGTSGQDESIVQSIVALAHALGLRVIAEGVETVAQATTLCAMGCGYAQGWHFGHPEPAHRFARLLRLDGSPVAEPVGSFAESCPDRTGTTPDRR